MEIREIKFRAWDTEYRTWVGIPTNSIVEKDVQILRLFDDRRRRIEIQQFTGLKDKNGKEIFEGDILRVKLDGGFESFLVVWQQNKMGFGLRDLNKVDLIDSWAFTPKNDFEIIGNKFENPELLEVQGG